MTIHSYPLTAVIGDYLRAGIGIGIGAVPLVFVSSKPLMNYILIAVICIFVAYGLRTVIKHLTRIEIDDEKIVVTLPFRRKIAWRDLSSLRLKYYSTKRSWLGGWLQMALRGEGQTIAIESTVSGFQEIVTRATSAAGANGVPLDDASAANLASMDKVLGGDQAFGGASP